MEANCWVLWVNFVNPMALSIFELPLLTGDSNESNVMLSDDDSSPKSAFDQLRPGGFLC
jgi:hypothetical protein